jgi:hypothetical protein
MHHGMPRREGLPLEVPAMIWLAMLGVGLAALVIGWVAAVAMRPRSDLTESWKRATKKDEKPEGRVE